MTEVRKYIPGSIRENNLQKIMLAAEYEFVEYGFKKTTTQNIANRAGLPKSNVHYYFKNKLSLYCAILEGILKLWDKTLNNITEDDDPEDVIRTFIIKKMESARDNPRASQIFAAEVMGKGKHLKHYYNDNYPKWFTGRANVIKSWIDQGKMESVDPEHLIFLLWATTQHYADFMFQITAALGKKELTNDDYARAIANITHIVLKGCGVKCKSKAAIVNSAVCAERVEG